MDDEILEEFLLESVEALDALDVELVQLEQEPGSTALLSSIFRRVHTIKGTCGFLGFATLERVSHVGENLLSKLRDGELAVTGPITTALLSMNDALRDMLDHIQDTGEEGIHDFTELCATLEALTRGEEPAVPEPAPASAAPVAERPVVEAPVVEEPVVEEPVVEEPVVEEPVADDVATQPSAEDGTAEGYDTVRDAATAFFDGLRIPDGVRLGDLLLASGKITRVQLESALRRQSHGDPRRIGEILLEMGAVSPDDVVETLNAQNEVRNVAESTIRVDVAILDRLMNLVGELVLARNQILQVTGEGMDSTLTATSQRLDHITTELQSGVMQTRMQPIENAWSKFPRVVRDLARSLSKDVRLEMVGQETELDKSLLEAIRDPLTHLVRNAVDHGLETPDERLKAGKPAQGTLLLKAYHEGGQVNIEVADDGRGLDLERVRQKAVEKELMTAEKAARLSQRELVDLVFSPGFSTAQQVTKVSGRGVGMDVVKTNIEKIGGSIDLQTRPGAGTTVKVRIPLTLAIIPALIVTDGGQHYAIPQVSLLELVHLDGADLEREVEWVDGTPVYRLRGELLPLVFLDATLGQADRERERDGLNVVVLQAGERNFGLVVDEINDSAEIVVKPLGSSLSDVRLFAGATIMGDGQVALILDVGGVAEDAGLRLDTGEQFVFDDDAEDDDEVGDKRTLLLFTLGSDRRYAIPLDMVTRLEEVDPARIERSGDHAVIQYRGEIMPVVELAALFERDVRGAESDGPLQVIVHREEDLLIGIAVGSIVDIVDERVDVLRPLDVPGLAGSVVIGGLVTDLVDVAGVQRLTGLHRQPAHA